MTKLKESSVSNTNIKIYMKLEDPEETMKIFLQQNYEYLKKKSPAKFYYVVKLKLKDLNSKLPRNC